MELIIINLMDKFGYFGIFFLIFIENLFPPIPSEVILTFGGFMTKFTSMNIPIVIITSTLGAVSGAIVLYYLGTIFSEERLIKIITSKYGKLLRLKPTDIKNANAWFIKQGNKAIFICRFIPIIRSLISIPAGMNKMKMSIFLLYTTVATAIWNTVLIILGRVLGDKWHVVVDIFSKYSKITLYIIIIVLIILIVLFYIKRIKKGDKND